MQVPPFVRRILEDPPPRFVFEVSERGIAAARGGRPPQIGFQPLEDDVIAVSPVEDNVRRIDAFTAGIQAIAPREKKRERAVVILPDFAVRTSVLDFDAFPSEPDEQRSLVRFRIKKSLPFDLEAASLSYYPQHSAATKRWDVVVSVAPIEILARYETPFRSSGFHPGLITTSSLCALEMIKTPGVAVMAKLSGRTLTIAVTDRGALKLLRTIELAAAEASEIASHLYPTFAYVEDQLGTRPAGVLTCGLGRLNEELAIELGEECTPLRSQYGAPDQFNAGLLGYLESIEELTK